MTLVPVSDRILVSPIQKTEAKTAAGILLPSDRDQSLDRGKVLAVGPGCYQNGTHIPVRACNVGDEIVYEGGYPTTIAGERVVLLFESNVIAVVRE